ncbi:MAG: CPBP family intramembrane metalloprotease [Gemmataceae bacterium]|nr:CPBP family intramembrane metalloprotease [Gemmataceae bacterium]
MSDAELPPTDSPAPAGPPPDQPLPRRWPAVWVLLAWVVIAGGVFWQAAGRYLVAESPRQEAVAEEMAHLTTRVQARYAVGAHELFPMPAMYEQMKALNAGPIGQRLRFVVLAGDLAGPAEALRQLRDLDAAARHEKVKYTPRQRAVRDILERLYWDHEALRFRAPSVSRAERAELRRVLDWFGELALAPSGTATPAQLVLPAAGGPAATAVQRLSAPDADARAEVVAPAQRTFLAVFVTFAAAALAAFAGLVGLIVFLVLVFRGTVRSAIHCGQPHGGVYAETFALWMALFAGFGLLGVLLPSEAPRLLLSGAVGLLSLVALGWPVLRGVPWRQVREDVGLTLGRRPALEPLNGLACYAMNLPVVAIGMTLTLVLVLVQREFGGGDTNSFSLPPNPAHPIVEDVAHGGLWERLQILVLACAIAPVVEEIMFRGVLYRHLREATCRLRTGWSYLLSATVVSFVFAVIHPQGLVAVPVLMALAYGFAMAREWRGTLVAAIVGHAFNNGIVMTVAILAFGD